MDQGTLNLEPLWFALIGVLWIGYFFLEGFDFGVGILMPFLGKDDTDRRVMINTIGPVWDGNEVWLIVAGGATFAAFPELVRDPVQRLLPRAVPDPRGADLPRGRVRVPRQGPHPEWGRWWDRAIFWGSARAGAAVGRRVRQHPARGADRRNKEFVGPFFDLLNPFALLSGVTSLAAVHAARRGRSSR